MRRRLTIQKLLLAVLGYLSVGSLIFAVMLLALTGGPGLVAWIIPASLLIIILSNSLEHSIQAKLDEIDDKRRYWHITDKK